MAILDSRGMGAPADIGVFEGSASIIVYQHTFSGVTYVCAARCGDSGWVLVDYRSLTGANATAVINAGLAALTAGRTWKETMIVKGNYTDLSRITGFAYTILEIQGKLQAKVNLNQHFVYFNAVSDVEILGGEIDGNGANQTADMDTIYFGTVRDGMIKGVTVRGARRVVTDGENIELENCWMCIVTECKTFVYHDAGYDHIKLTGTSRHNIISNNICDGSAMQPSNAIQLATGADENIIVDNVVYSNDRGIKCHNANKNLIEGNKIYFFTSGGAGIEFIQDAGNNLAIGNYVYNAIREALAVRDVAGVGAAISNVFDGNYVYLGNDVNAIGIRIYLNSIGTRIVNNYFFGGITTNIGIQIDAGAQTTYIEGNDLLDPAVTTKLTDAGTGTIIKRNRGYPTDFGYITHSLGVCITELPADNNNYYVGFMGIGSYAAENLRQQTIPHVCTLKTLRVTLTVAPTGVGKSRTFTVRKNGINTALTVTITNAAVTGSDLVNSVAFAAGDLIGIRQIGANLPAASYANWGALMVEEGDNV